MSFNTSCYDLFVMFLLFFLSLFSPPCYRIFQFRNFNSRFLDFASRLLKFALLLKFCPWLSKKMFLFLLSKQNVSLRQGSTNQTKKEKKIPEKSLKVFPNLASRQRKTVTPLFSIFVCFPVSLLYSTLSSFSIKFLLQ